MQSKYVTWLVASFSTVLVAGIILLIVATVPSRNYHVAIDSVSGFDLPPSKDPVLDPQFNLTLRLTSTNPIRRECMNAHTYVQVAYRCVPLASVAPPHRLCVGPKKSTEVQLVAKATGIRLDGHLMDNLAADMRSGTEAFNVRLMMSDGSFWVSSCGATRVGDGGAWCGDLWDMCTPRREPSSDDVIFYSPISMPPEE